MITAEKFSKNAALVVMEVPDYVSEMIAGIEALFTEALALLDDSRLQLVERLIPTIQVSRRLSRSRSRQCSARWMKCVTGG